MTDTEIKIERLYRILEDLAKDDKYEDAATVRWAIFQIETAMNIKRGRSKI